MSARPPNPTGKYWHMVSLAESVLVTISPPDGHERVIDAMDTPPTDTSTGNPTSSGGAGRLKVYRSNAPVGMDLIVDWFTLWGLERYRHAREVRLFAVFST
ncbi:hypothetical protein FOZ62_024995 [Perkinsus olseni]|uniref:Uncharacterized protein n=1 Tax=Perkinsus olseni TaxID=32597 RepID=A0A7J6REM4_PEROL|nr:hypothetical protein FOZ62_024995 [Perkinsus olseni]